MRAVGSAVKREDGMQIGVMGLGRMGANIARRLMRRGHGCVVYDRDSAPGRTLAAEGAATAASPADLVKALGPRAWSGSCCLRAKRRRPRSVS